MNENCTYSDENIWDYFSNALSREDEIRMQEHVYTCEQCQRRLNKLRTLDEIIGEIEEPEIEPSQKKKPIREYLVIAGAVAAIAALIFILTPSSPDQPPYPIDELDQPGYGTGDSIRVDSTDNKIDTIY